MTRTRLYRALLVAVAVLALAGGLVAVVQAASSPVLVVTDADTGDVLIETPVEEGTTVTLEYMHSVEKTTVRDVYVVDDGRLRMTRMEFSSFGWGLPAREDIDGYTEDGDFLLTFENRTYDRIGVVPGRVAGHSLRVGDTRYDLVEQSNASAVELSVERDRPLRQLFGYT